MPTYRVASPEGKTYRVTTDRPATQAELIEYVQSQLASGSIKPYNEPAAQPAPMEQEAGDTTVGEWLEGRGSAIAAGYGTDILAAASEIASRPQDVILGGRKSAEAIEEQLGFSVENPYFKEKAEQFRAASEELKQHAYELGGDNFATELVDSLNYMAGSVLTTRVTGKANLGLGVMGGMVFSTSLTEQLNKGLSFDDAAKQAAIQVIFELGPEKAFGFFDSLPVTKGFKAWFKGVLQEGASELATEELNILYEKFGEGEVNKYFEDFFADMPRRGKAGAAGMVMGGGLTIDKPFRKPEDPNAGQDLTEAELEFHEADRQARFAVEEEQRRRQAQLDEDAQLESDRLDFLDQRREAELQTELEYEQGGAGVYTDEGIKPAFVQPPIDAREDTRWELLNKAREAANEIPAEERAAWFAYEQQMQSLDEIYQATLDEARKRSTEQRTLPLRQRPYVDDTTRDVSEPPIVPEETLLRIDKAVEDLDVDLLLDEYESVASDTEAAATDVLQYRNGTGIFGTPEAKQAILDKARSAVKDAWKSPFLDVRRANPRTRMTRDDIKDMNRTFWEVEKGVPEAAAVPENTPDTVIPDEAIEFAKGLDRSTSVYPEGKTGNWNLLAYDPNTNKVVVEYRAKRKDKDGNATYMRYEWTLGEAFNPRKVVKDGKWDAAWFNRQEKNLKKDQDNVKDHIPKRVRRDLEVRLLGYIEGELRTGNRKLKELDEGDWIVPQTHDRAIDLEFAKLQNQARAAKREELRRTPSAQDIADELDAMYRAGEFNNKETLRNAVSGALTAKLGRAPTATEIADEIARRYDDYEVMPERDINIEKPGLYEEETTTFREAREGAVNKARARASRRINKDVDSSLTEQESAELKEEAKLNVEKRHSNTVQRVIDEMRNRYTGRFWNKPKQWKGFPKFKGDGPAADQIITLVEDQDIPRQLAAGTALPVRIVQVLPSGQPRVLEVVPTAVGKPYSVRVRSMGANTYRTPLEITTMGGPVQQSVIDRLRSESTVKKKADADVEKLVRSYWSSPTVQDIDLQEEEADSAWGQQAARLAEQEKQGKPKKKRAKKAPVEHTAMTLAEMELWQKEEADKAAKKELREEVKALQKERQELKEKWQEAVKAGNKELAAQYKRKDKELQFDIKQARLLTRNIDPVLRREDLGERVEQSTSFENFVNAISAMQEANQAYKEQQLEALEDGTEGYFPGEVATTLSEEEKTERYNTLLVLDAARKAYSEQRESSLKGERKRASTRANKDSMILRRMAQDVRNMETAIIEAFDDILRPYYRVNVKGTDRLYIEQSIEQLERDIANPDIPENKKGRLRERLSSFEQAYEELSGDDYVGDNYQALFPAATVPGRRTDRGGGQPVSDSIVGVKQRQTIRMALRDVLRANPQISLILIEHGYNQATNDGSIEAKERLASSLARAEIVTDQLDTLARMLKQGLIANDPDFAIYDNYKLTDVHKIYEQVEQVAAATRAESARPAIELDEAVVEAARRELGIDSLTEEELRPYVRPARMKYEATTIDDIRADVESWPAGVPATERLGKRIEGEVNLGIETVYVQEPLKNEAKASQSGAAETTVAHTGYYSINNTTGETTLSFIRVGDVLIDVGALRADQDAARRSADSKFVPGTPGGFSYADSPLVEQIGRAFAEEVRKEQGATTEDMLRGDFLSNTIQRMRASLGEDYAEQASVNRQQLAEDIGRRRAQRSLDLRRAEAEARERSAQEKELAERERRRAELDEVARELQTQANEELSAMRQERARLEQLARDRRRLENSDLYREETAVAEEQDREAEAAQEQQAFQFEIPFPPPEGATLVPDREYASAIEAKTLAETHPWIIDPAFIEERVNQYRKNYLKGTPDAPLVKTDGRTIAMDDPGVPGRAEFEAAVALDSIAPGLNLENIKRWKRSWLSRYAGVQKESRDLVKLFPQAIGRVQKHVNAAMDAWNRARVELNKLPGYKRFTPSWDAAVTSYLQDMSHSSVLAKTGIDLPPQVLQHLDTIKQRIHVLGDMGIQRGSWDSGSVLAAVMDSRGYLHRTAKQKKATKRHISNAKAHLGRLARRAWDVATTEEQLENFSDDKVLFMLSGENHGLFDKYLKDSQVMHPSGRRHTHVHLDIEGKGTWDLGKRENGAITKKVLMKNLRMQNPNLSKEQISELFDKTMREIRNAVATVLPKDTAFETAVEELANSMVEDFENIQMRRTSAGAGADMSIKRARNIMRSDADQIAAAGVQLWQYAPEESRKKVKDWIETNLQSNRTKSFGEFMLKVKANFPELKEQIKQAQANNDLNEALRGAINEITDPETTIFDTVNRLAETVHTSELVMNIMKLGVEQGWAAYEPEHKTGDMWEALAPKDSKFGQTPVAVPGKSNADGLPLYIYAHEIKVPREVALAVKDLANINREQESPVWQYIRQATGLTKWGLVIGSATGQSRNYVSTAAIHVLRNPVGYEQLYAHKVGLALYSNQARKALTRGQRAKASEADKAAARRLEKMMLDLGMLYDGGKSGVMWDIRRRGLGAADPSIAFYHRVGEKGQAVMHSAEEMFRLSDEWVKMPAFIMRTAEYLDYLGYDSGLMRSYLEGNKLTKEQRTQLDEAAKIASEVVLDEYPTFSRINRLGKALSRNLVFGAFPGFQFEMVRTTKNAFRNNLLLMAGYLPNGQRVAKQKRAAAAGLGAMRSASSMSSVGILSLITTLLAPIVWGDDDEESRIVQQAGGDWEYAQKLMRGIKKWWARDTAAPIANINTTDGSYDLVRMDYLWPTGGLENAARTALARMSRALADNDSNLAKEIALSFGDAIIPIAFNQEPLFGNIYKRYMRGTTGTKRKDTWTSTHLANNIDEALGGDGDGLGNLGGAVAGGLVDSAPAVINQFVDATKFFVDLAKEYPEDQQVQYLADAGLRTIQHMTGARRERVEFEKDVVPQIKGDMYLFGQATTLFKQGLADPSLGSYEEFRSRFEALNYNRKDAFDNVHTGIVGSRIVLWRSAGEIEAGLGRTTAGGLGMDSFYSGRYAIPSLQEMDKYLRQRAEGYDPEDPNQVVDHLSLDDMSRLIGWYREVLIERGGGAEFRNE